MFGQRRKKRNELDDLQMAYLRLRQAVQSLSMVEGPDKTAYWLGHYKGLLEMPGPFRMVAEDVHQNYKERL